MSEAPWYRSLFGEDYLRIYGPRLTAERTEREVEGIIRLLDLPPGSAILDLACGHGRHAMALAKRGYRVTGQDLSETFLERARSDAAAARVDVRWVRGDMRSIPFEDEFDVVINVFTAFGYLESDAEDLKVLREVRKALEPGGRFLIEYIHHAGLLREYREANVERRDDGLVLVDEGRFDLLSGRNEVRTTMLFPDGRRTEHRHSVRVYALTELTCMLAEGGLSTREVYGGLDGSPLTLDSMRVVVVSEKPAGGITK